ncbi:MAG: cupin domain-containing protein [Candidatus Accumulibacter sp.]|uniref:cupin domain-containing protein n=1 Tax=Accumulibacter sp. TaxID=2053492 RepID=UPI00258BA474|nr:cupin domain-containing protein [Accumulibacter sp.]MCM8624031.1 cupin domain-containing protein [Accumulibacter sp.]
MKPIRNLDKLTLTPHAAGTRYAAQFAQLGPLIGARKLGCRFNVIPPGKAAWPFHSHLVNEELVVVLSGRGTLRFGSERLPLRAGDVVGLPPGGAECAHQIINEGNEELRYLAVSTMEEPDIGLYPDSGKFAVFAGTAPGGDKSRRSFSYVGRPESAVDYWDGE